MTANVEEEDLQFAFGPRVGPGKFVVVEGFDGTGKTTLVSALYRSLLRSNYRVAKVRFPSTIMRRSMMFRLFAKHNREDLIDVLAMQVQQMADRIQESKKVVSPLLANEYIVLADRYVSASVDTMLDRSIPLNGWFKDLCQQLVAPDLAVYMHAPADIVLDRIRSRPEEQDFPLSTSQIQAIIERGKIYAKHNNMIELDSAQLNVLQCTERVRSYLLGR